MNGQQIPDRTARTQPTAITPDIDGQAALKERALAEPAAGIAFAVFELFVVQKQVTMYVVMYG